MNKDKQPEDNKEMLANVSSDKSPSPSLRIGDDNFNHGAGEEETRTWGKKVLDLQEAKKQVLFSLPMVLANVFYFGVPLVSVMFAGNLGKHELAGATLANSWAAVTGILFMVGSSGALETLCGQGFGAKEYKMLGIHLQASCIISVFFSIIISIIWFFTEPILLLLHQDHGISKQAALYMKYLIPSIFAYGFLESMLRFLQTQSVVVPLVVFSAVPLAIHVGIAYALVHWTSLGFKAPPLAVSISTWISTLPLGVYVLCSKKFEHTWQGFSFESFRYIIPTLKLALSSAAMVCLEGWAFEILVFLAGLMKDSEVTTSLIAICANTEAVAYMITYGLSAAASTRVSNELGAGNVNRAKNAMATTVKLSTLLALAVILALVFGHNIWAGFFSNSPEIIKKFASLIPFLAIVIGLDSLQGVLSGVARGCGWQHLVMLANLSTFYLIGMPIAALLGFKLKLETKGLLMGLLCGLSCQAIALLLITWRKKWSKLDIAVNRETETSVLSSL